MLLLARSAAITKKPYRSTCNKNNVSLQLKARVNANMRLVFFFFARPTYPREGGRWETKHFMGMAFLVVVNLAELEEL